MTPISRLSTACTNSRLIRPLSGSAMRAALKVTWKSWCFRIHSYTSSPQMLPQPIIERLIVNHADVEDSMMCPCASVFVAFAVEEHVHAHHVVRYVLELE